MKRATAMQAIRVLQRVKPVGEPVRQAMDYALIGSDLARFDVAAGFVFTRRAELLMPKIRGELGAAVKRGDVPAAVEKRILAALSKEIGAVRAARRLESARKRLARAKAADLDTTAGTEELAEALRSVLRDEIAPLHMDRLMTLLTAEDWRRLVRRAAKLEPTAVRTMTGLIHEIITSRMPEFKQAVKEALRVAKRLPDGWRPLIPKDIKALDMDDKTLRSYVDKGVFAVHDGPPKLAASLMTWEDKNESNLRDLLGEDGQLAQGKHRLEGAMLRLDGDDYFVPQRLSDVLRDNRYIAAPKPLSDKQLFTLVVGQEINVRPVVSPVPSKAIAQVGLRMIELLAPLR